MADKYIEAELHGTALVTLALGSSGERRRSMLKELLSDTARIATADIRAQAPSGQSGYLHQHIHQSGITYLPGGAGGGGTYQIVTGVLRGTSLHPLYVHQGTKNEFGPENIEAAAQAGQRIEQGRIYPRGYGVRERVYSIASRMERANSSRFNDKFLGRRPALAFRDRSGRMIFRAWVRGQSPQPFVYWAFVTASVYTQGRLRTSAMRGAF